ncbi:nucleotide-binding protein [Erysipelotrichaceae bacterium]|nr:nucleotide-binding protein [Erysipelotrichaceae bacterium]
MLKVLLVCGMSGAGKTTAQSALEDLGYMCIDNMPPTFIPQVVELVEKKGDFSPAKIGFIFDVKFHSVNNILAALVELREKQVEMEFLTELLFLEATDSVLLGRYRETRRKHPFASGSKTLEQAIEKERDLMQRIKEKSDVIIDTSGLNMKELTLRLTALFNEDNNLGIFNVMFMSFGFKHGVPKDADFVLDVRFLANPFYDKNLRYLTGKNMEVSNFVLENSEGRELFEKTKDYLSYILKKNKENGRNNFVIAIGCTGGQHRSVAIAEALFDSFKPKYLSFIMHRDMEMNQQEVFNRYKEDKKHIMKG